VSEPDDDLAQIGARARKKALARAVRRRATQRQWPLERHMPEQQSVALVHAVPLTRQQTLPWHISDAQQSVVAEHGWCGIEHAHAPRVHAPEQQSLPTLHAVAAAKQHIPRRHASPGSLQHGVGPRHALPTGKQHPAPGRHA
jgi:hypothetical protein